MAGTGLFHLTHFKDIPGFEAILKVIIKSQILKLVNQLAEQTGEQTVVLTADITQRTFTQFGSVDSVDFLTDRDEVHTEFLMHCIQKHKLRQQRGSPHEDIDSTGKPNGEPSAENTMPDSASRADIPKPEMDTGTLSREKPTRRAVKRRRAVKNREISVTGAKLQAGDKSSSLDKKPPGQIKKSKTKENREMLSGSIKIGQSIDTNEKTSVSAFGDTDDHVSDSDGAGESHVTTDGESHVTMEADTLIGQQGYAGNQDAVSDDGEDQEEGTSTSDNPGDDDSGEENNEEKLSERNKIGESSLGVSHIRTQQSRKESLSKSGRKFVSGQALNEDLRTSIVLQIVDLGGDSKTGKVPRGMFTRVSKALGVNTSSVTRIWERFVNDGTIKPRQHATASKPP